MKLKFILPALALSILTVVHVSAATIIENWQFNETSNTQFTGLVNSVGTGAWSGNDPDVATNGSGQLVFSQGSETDPDNVFRNSTLTTLDVSSGIYELEWFYDSASIVGGDASGANVGFGIRDLGADNLAGGTEANIDTDLFLVRVQRQNSVLRLEYRTTATTLLQNFNVTTIDNLLVRAVFNLDTDTVDVFWKLGAGAEQSSIGLAMAASGLQIDSVRLAANTNTADWGAADTVSVDYLKLSQIPEPTAALLGSLGLLGLLRRRR